MPNRRILPNRGHCNQVHQFAQLKDGIFTQYTPRKTHKQILQTKHTFTTKLRGRPFDSAGEEGGGGLAVYVEASNLLRATIFISIQLQQRPFILRYSLFESDGCFFPRDPGHNIYE